MSIQRSGKDLLLMNGKELISRAMVGKHCVYGEMLKIYKLEYPSVAEGAGFYIDVNHKRVVENPVTSGQIDVFAGDNIVIRTYGKIGFQNPNASVTNGTDSVIGEIYYVNCQDLSVARATTFKYSVSENGKLSLNSPSTAPKVDVNFDLDDGIQNVSFQYIKSPYDYSGNGSISPSKVTSNSFTGGKAQLYVGSIITQDDVRTSVNEGYKLASSSKSFTGVLTEGSVCTITVRSTAGVKSQIVCPAVPDGVEKYEIFVIQSDYSRNVSADIAAYTVHFDQTVTASTTISQRQINGRTCYFYVGDLIKIRAVRKSGYKIPTLGKQGDISTLVTEKTVSIEQLTELVVISGQKGISVLLINNPLPSGEYVYIDVSSEYYETEPKQTHPLIYVGDTISIPLDPSYRIGTLQNRKPGVGIIADDNEIATVVFDSRLSIVVPNAQTLTIKLVQGALRVPSKEFNASLSKLLEFDKKGSKTSQPWGATGILKDGIEPIDGFGAEGYFLSKICLKYSCKRYLGDIITSKFVKYVQEDIPTPFSYSHKVTLGQTYDALIGNFSISDDGTSLTMNISKYNDNVVADSTDWLKVYPSEIII